MNISRRWFIGGLSSALAFGGCKMFTAPVGKFSSGKAKLTFGVVSDVHILYDGKTHKINIHSNGDTLENTFGWFRDQGVDAVVIAGDIADKGIVEELQCVADVWNKVFPGNKAPDGRTVEKIFVSGNHDVEGFRYGNFAARVWSDKNERAKHLLETDFKGNWEKIFNEEYNNIYKKEVNGYTFIGQHWGNQGWGKNCKFDLIKPFMEENKSKINTSLPFFYVQHPHPKNTCYGPTAWGSDIGVTTEVLSKFPTAVAFSGHSHYSLADKHSIWQGTFTSIGTASLRYVCAHHEALPGGYENYHSGNSKDVRLSPSYRVMSLPNRSNVRQGMLVKVFEDCITIQRREFVRASDIGEEWVMPLSTAEGKPFAFAEHAKRDVAPEFPADAKVSVSKSRAKNRGDKKVKSVVKDVLVIDFPKACEKKGGDLYSYEIFVESQNGKDNQTRYMLSMNYKGAKKVTSSDKEYTLKIACDTLPEKTKYRFVISPVSSLGSKGKSITSDWV